VNMKKAEIIGIVGLVATVVGGLFAVLAFIGMYHIAAKQGAFETSNVELGFDNVTFRDGDNIQVFLGVSDKLRDTDDVLLPVEFKVRNRGDRVLDDVLVSFAYDKRSNRAAIPILDQYMGHHGAVTSEYRSHETNSSAEADYSNFKFRKLNVGRSLSIGDGAYAYRGNELSGVPLLSSLGADVTGTLDAATLRRQKFAFKYRLVELDSDEKLVAWFQNYYAKYTAIEIREKMGFTAYLWKLLYRRGDVTAYLIHPDYAALDVDGKRLWMPKKDYTSLQKVVFYPFSWSLLFG